MNYFSRRQDQYKNVFEACLKRVIEAGESLQKVLLDYPGWAEQLEEDIQLAQELISLQESFDPRPSFLDAARGVILDQATSISTQQTKDCFVSLRSTRDDGFQEARNDLWDGAILFRRIRDCFTSFAMTVVNFLKNNRFPERQLRFVRKGMVLVAILTVIVLGLGATRLLSYDALPGSGLFPVRKVLESAQLVLTIHEEKKAETHLGFAQSYLVDYAVLVSKGKGEDANLALRQYDHHIVSTIRILQYLSASGDEDYSPLQNLFTRTYLQDLEIFQVLSQRTIYSLRSS